MIIVQKDTTPIADECILLGRQCENEARQIEFDLSWLIDEYGSGTAVLVHQRNKDVAPYICTTTQSDNILTWTLDNQDTVYDGWGQAELRWTVGDVLAKTLVYKTMVIRSITADTTIPEPLESWYDEMIDYIDEHGIDPEDLAAAIAAYLDEHPVEAPVQSVNSKTGDVVLTASDVGAGTYTKPSGGIPDSDIASASTWNGKYTKPGSGIPATDIASGVIPPIKGIWSGYCSTAATTKAKVVTLADPTGFTLTAGVKIIVLFRHGSSAQSPTLNVESTGAKSISYSNKDLDSLFISGVPFNLLGVGLYEFTYYDGSWFMGTPSMPMMHYIYTSLTDKANKASPTFTGTPKAPTAATGTDTTQLATTAFVQQEIATIADTLTATESNGTVTLSLT